MAKLQAARVEKMPLKTESPTRSRAIETIRDNRMADGRQMNADLMGYAGFHFNFD